MQRQIIPREIARLMTSLAMPSMFLEFLGKKHVRNGVL